MYAFDALIGNEGRSQDRLLYDAKEWNLLLTGHDRAFGTKKEFPAHLQQRPPARRRAPQAPRRPGRSRSQTTLGDLIGKREIKTLLQRRDAVLAGAAATATGR